MGYNRFSDNDNSRKKSVIFCLAALLAVVLGIAVYISVRPKSPGTEENSTENREAAGTASICALSYDIDLKLDTEKERLEQTVLIDIANKSEDEDFSCLYIRYYPNGNIGYILEEIPEEREANEGKSSAVTSVTWRGSEEQLKKGVLDILTKHNDSEEIRKLIEFYFPGGGDL